MHMPRTARVLLPLAVLPLLLTACGTEKVVVAGREPLVPAPDRAELHARAEALGLAPGLVHVTELGRDYFHFDANRHAMIGERTGRVFQLAGRVRVTVARVDLEATKIDFTLAEETAPEIPTPANRPKYSEPLARSDRPAGRKSRR